MLNPSDALVDMYTQCSHQTASIVQLDQHKHVYELFHATDEPEQFACVCCNNKSYYQIELYEHCNQAHKTDFTSSASTRYECNHCRFSTDSSLSFIKHDDFCGKLPQDSTQEPMDLADVEVMIFLPTHDSSDTNDGLIQCGHCSYRTRVMSHFKRHNTSKHVAARDINWFRCEHCSYQTKRRDCLKSHMFKHAPSAEIVWFQCGHCSYRTERKRNLKTHILQHAANEEINWFQCNVCSYRTKQKVNLKLHILTHASNEEIDWFQCNYCAYRAKLESYLKKHMLRHAANEEIRWFQCNRCSYRSKYKSTLKRHFMSKHA